MENRFQKFVIIFKACFVAFLLNVMLTACSKSKMEESPTPVAEWERAGWELVWHDEAVRSIFWKILGNQTPFMVRFTVSDILVGMGSAVRFES